MTTIVYKDGIIAYDSRLTGDGMIYSDSFDKRIKRENWDFFLSGRVSDFEPFMDAFVANEKLKEHRNIYAFAVQNGEGFYVDCDESAGADGLYSIRTISLKLLNEGYALGSGYQFATAYLKIGKSPAEAVELTKLNDSATGGEVRVFSVADGY